MADVVVCVPDVSVGWLWVPAMVLAVATETVGLADCPSTMTSPLEWMGAIAADARPLDNLLRVA